jgi:regulator of sigma E protease
MRDGHLQHVRIPRIPVGEIKLTAEVKGEISDWQYASGLQHKKLQELWFLPYNLTSDGVVEGPLSLLDVEGKKRLWPGRDKLLPHDRIVAVAGKKVSTSAEILKNFQEKRVLVIVERGGAPLESYKNAEKSLNDGALSQDLMAIVQSIGSESPITQSGNFILLHPITPKTRAELLHTTETSGLRDEEIQALQSIEDPKLRSAAEDSLRLRHKQLYLGLLGVHDEAVLYNPNPFVVAESVASEIYHTMVALFGGYLSPRWMSGPVGILQVIQHQLSVGYMEALFWLGTISLNLAILNLLPLPVLDGGYILLSLFERITGIRLRVETIEKIVLPFAILLIGFLIYLTYYDVVRLLHNFFSTWKVW